MTLLARLPQKDAVPLPKDLKILHVFDHSLPLMSGYAVRSVSILRAQRARGWRTVHLTTPKHTAAGPSPEQVGEFQFHRSAPFAGGMPYLRELGFIRHVAREIARVAELESPDLLHAHSPALNGVAALMAGRRLGIPVVYEVRAFWEDGAVDLGTAKQGGLRYRLTRAMESHVLRRCHAAAAICNGLSADIIARGIDSAKIGIIGNGVRVEDFAFRAPADPMLRTRLGLDGKTVLGFLGSFYAYEGLDLLLDALPAVLKQAPGTALLLVGGGPVEAALKQQAERLGLGEHVRFIGRVPHEEVGNYYNLVDILVYPRHSIRLTETVTPLKPLEAMAQGGLVLASDIGGHRELIHDGETGHLFPADDKAALAAAILRLMREREGWDAMRRRGRAFVERERNWTATTAGYDRLYARALEAQSAR